MQYGGQDLVDAIHPRLVGFDGNNPFEFFWHKTQVLFEGRGAAYHRCRRVVQLVGQACRKLAERNHLLILLVELGEAADAVQHQVDETFDQCVLGGNHLRKLVAMQPQYGSFFQGNGTSYARFKAGVGQ